MQEAAFMKEKKKAASVTALSIGPVGYKMADSVRRKFYGDLWL